MEETAKRESIYNLPQATVLHTFSPAVAGSQKGREDSFGYARSREGSRSVQSNQTSAFFQRIMIKHREVEIRPSFRIHWKKTSIYTS